MERKGVSSYLQTQLNSFYRWASSFAKGTSFQKQSSSKNVNLIDFANPNLWHAVITQLCGLEEPTSTSDWNTVLSMAKAQGIRVVGVQATHLKSADESSLLTFAWGIIRHLILPNTGKASNYRAILMSWCSEILSKQKAPELKNIATSFLQGKLLCYILSSVESAHCDLTQVSKNDPPTNLAYGIKQSADLLSIPVLFDASEILSQPDEKSILLYLALLYNKIHDRQHNLKLSVDEAVVQESIDKLITFRARIEDLHKRNLQSTIQQSSAGEVAQLEKELENLRHQNLQKDNMLSLSQDKVASLAELLGQKNAELERCESTNRQLKGEKESLVQSNTVLQEKLDRLQDSLQEQKLAYQVIADSMQTLRNSHAVELKVLEKEVAQLRQENDTKTEGEKRKSQSDQEAARHIVQLSEQVAKYEATVEQMRLEASKETQALKDGYDTKILQLRSEINQLKRKSTQDGHSSIQLLLDSQEETERLRKEFDRVQKAREEDLLEFRSKMSNVLEVNQTIITSYS
eukprot:TRINITY_DN2088_c0_g1_i7.p1 TRINITY_DN2088_c0_g1~~TRINITY_DN2088_c0_g1_i7.p1  ORF type:complete len:518 (+),score=102.06 TRINITY_DN2088_c0_g1_i7:62-1615(+)